LSFFGVLAFHASGLYGRKESFGLQWVLVITMMRRDVDWREKC
jgi:hypothetical protein